MQWWSTIVLLLGFAAGQVSAQKPPRVRVLIVDGQNNHDWIATSGACRTILESVGRFEVATSTSPPAHSPKETWKGWRPEFASYDVVLSNYNGELWPEPVRRAFESYVSKGGGLVVVHAADNAFPSWPAWNQMIAVGGWGGRNEGSGPLIRWRDGKMVLDPRPGRGGHHGRQHAFVVETRAPDHPIMKGLPARWRHAPDELYDSLRGPAENVTVLATAFSSKDTGGSGEHEPILMDIRYGKGRIFHTTLGHQGRGQKSPVALACVGFATTLARGTEWAATGAVTLPVPAYFPGADEPRLLDLLRPVGPHGFLDGWRLVYQQDFESSDSLADLALANPPGWRLRTEAENGVLELVGSSGYRPPHRSPLNIALVDGVSVGDFMLEARLLQTGRDYGHRDLCVFFGFRDPSHYYYVHIATRSDPNAHNIMIVDGKPRRKISSFTTSGHDWGRNRWHRLRLMRTLEKGKIEVYVNDMKKPIMTATDSTHGAGLVGFGSFDDTGLFDDIRIWAPRMESHKAGFFTRGKVSKK